MKPLITLSLLLLPFLGFAQKKQNVYFLKNDGRYVDNKDSADYIRIIQEPDSASVLYNVYEFYPDGVKKLIGKSKVIDPPRFDGTCVSYYKSGIKKSVENYKDDSRVGSQYEYYPNGKIYLGTVYPDSVDKDNFVDNFLIMAELDSSGNQIIVNGNGYYKGFDDHFKNIIEEGTLKEGKRVGTWKGYENSLNLHYNENYDDGRLISGISVGDKSDTIRYINFRSTSPAYKGGLEAFYSFVGKNVTYPDYERANNIQGRVILCFIIEANGKISNIKLLNSVSKNIDKEAVRVIKESPNWIPGTSYGRKVRTYYTIPLNFALKD